MRYEAVFFTSALYLFLYFLLLQLFSMKLFRKALTIQLQDGSSELLPIAKSTTISSSIHACIASPVTLIRILYHRSFSNCRSIVVSFSEASIPFILLRPTTVPPQPPTIKVQGSLPTGKVSRKKNQYPLPSWPQE